MSAANNTRGNPITPVDVLRTLCRYQTHSGYVWAAVMADGDMLCVPCLRANYRTVFRATVAAEVTRPDEEWRVIGHHNNGNSDQTEVCAHCHRVIWEKAE